MAVLASMLRRFTVPQASAKPAPAGEQPFASPDKVEDTAQLVGVLALIGPAVVLENGTFVRMLEVAPVDLERGDRSVKESYWAAFAQALRRLRAPAAWQIVITSRPQDTSAYRERWSAAERDWQALAERTAEPDVQARRQRLARSARETAAFLTALGESLGPMQQRYLIVITHNPFAEG
jgi:hypothetical protein